MNRYQGIVLVLYLVLLITTQAYALEEVDITEYGVESNVPTLQSTTPSSTTKDGDTQTAKKKKKKDKNKNRTPTSSSAPSSLPCPAQLKGSRCSSNPGCDNIQPKVCDEQNPNRCKTFKYGCQKVDAFCDFFQGDAASRQLQCAQYSDCAWNDRTQVCEPAKGTRPPATRIPTSNPSVKIRQPGSYSIDIKYTPATVNANLDFDFTKYFDNAANRWESIITNDINSTYLMKKGTTCYFDTIVADDDILVDDLLVFVDLIEIDGPSGALARAGPCILSKTGGLYSRVGLLQFDVADFKILKESGSLENAIVHEMGHVIGIGTLWNSYNLLNEVSMKSKSSIYYTGKGGQEGLASIGGEGQPIVESDGGTGTARSHFDEKEYKNELMTGWLDKDSKLSKMTIKSLEDLGFTVKIDQADSFQVPSNDRKTKDSLASNLRGSQEDSSTSPKHEMHKDTFDINRIKIVDATPK